jgi:hypothetical protein
VPHASIAFTGLPSHDRHFTKHLAGLPRFQTPATAEPVGVNKTLKDPRKIIAWEAKRLAENAADWEAAKAKAAEDFEKAYLATAHDGFFGHVGCIAAAVGADHPRVFTSVKVLAHKGKLVTDVSGETEAILELFEHLCGAGGYVTDIVVVGHGAKRLVQFLFRRCATLDISVPGWLRNAEAKTRHANRWIEDTAELGGDAFTRPIGPTLDHLAMALGLPPKLCMSLENAWQAISTVGAVHDVEASVMEDCRRTRSVFRMLCGHKPLDIDMAVPKLAEVAA